MSASSIGPLLASVQRDTFGYFVHEASPSNGLIKDKTATPWPSSITAVGLALAAYPVGVEAGLMPRDEAIRRTLTTLRFFRQSEQGPHPAATGYRGFYYHFLDMATGRRAWACELSVIDTAFLVAGMLAAAAYFHRDTPEERQIRDLADALYRRVDWDWARDGGCLLTHGWRPETGFLPYRWEGYDEALLLYTLALGSPTHPLPAESYRCWGASYAWKTIYGIPFLYSGPLFTHQLSHVWIDFRGIRDAFMRAKGIDYFENSRRATLIQQQYAIRNPQGWSGYGEHAWGITASDGPGPATRRIDGVVRAFYNYVARGVPYGPDDGSLAPWAVLASLPFAPEVVLPTVEYFEHLRLRLDNPYGFKATFNPTFRSGATGPNGWVSPYHFGLDQGPIVLMITNYQSGFLWELMRGCPYVVAGLRRAGFTGGWPAPAARRATGTVVALLSRQLPRVAGVEARGGERHDGGRDSRDGRRRLRAAGRRGARAGGPARRRVRGRPRHLRRGRRARRARRRRACRRGRGADRGPRRRGAGDPGPGWRRRRLRSGRARRGGRGGDGGGRDHGAPAPADRRTGPGRAPGHAAGPGRRAGHGK